MFALSRSLLSKRASTSRANGAHVAADPIDASRVVIDAASCSITDVRQEAGHLEYCLEINNGENPENPNAWTVWRRYRQFRAIHQALKQHRAAISPLPPKTLSFHGTSHKTGEVRVAALTKWLQDHLGTPNALAVPAMLEFIGYNASTPALPSSNVPTSQPPSASVVSGGDDEVIAIDDGALTDGVDEKIGAFISHFKKEAAMEARFLHEELQALVGPRRVFIDSDDLLNLSTLKSAVARSECLVLIQSSGVLERPWCLIEILTALEYRVPIIGVSLTSGAFVYNFEDAVALLASLDTHLAMRDPGATKILIEHGLDPESAAWQLSCTLPSVISIGFNPSASKNVLSATVADIAEAIKKAVPLSASQPKYQWLAARAAAAAAHGGDVRMMPSRSRSSSSHQRAAAASSSGAGQVVAMAPVPPEVPELPGALQLRPTLLDALKAEVLTVEPDKMNTGSATTAVVAAARSGKTATMAAHGMGGVGKTTAAVQLIRDPEVGAAFSKLLWVSVSMEPDLLELLGRLHFQMVSSKMPPIERDLDALQLLRALCKGAKVLLVLDDVWEGRHAEMLNVVDAEAGSACILTTRIHHLAEKEIRCGLLSVEESIGLLLNSAGLPELVHSPPSAAYEAVECCGRLALALPIAGGMIREMMDVWEEQLVPLLKAELSEELSIEERIVGASLRSVEASQRAGVESLFEVFGSFAEDEVVPAAALDILAPFICARALAIAQAAGGAPPPSSSSTSFVRRPQMSVRKWLGWLFNASILSGSAAKGASVHDLVRDCMLARVEKRDGGNGGLQREVLPLLVGAMEGELSAPTSASSSSKETRAFVLRSLRHHVSQVHRPAVPLRDDELLTALLNHPHNEICARAVAGIGLEALKAYINACEKDERWWEAAQLWRSAAALKGVMAGVEYGRALDAVSHVQPETDESQLLEARMIHCFLWSLGADIQWGSPAQMRLGDRAEALAAPFWPMLEEMLAADPDGLLPPPKPDANLFYRVHGANSIHLAISNNFNGWNKHIVLDLETLAESWREVAIFTHRYKLVRYVAPNLAQFDYASNCCLFNIVNCTFHHTQPYFDKDEICGVGGRRMRENVERYDFHLPFLPPLARPPHLTALGATWQVRLPPLPPNVQVGLHRDGLLPVWPQRVWPASILRRPRRRVQRLGEEHRRVAQRQGARGHGRHQLWRVRHRAALRHLHRVEHDGCRRVRPAARVDEVCSHGRRRQGRARRRDVEADVTHLPVLLSEWAGRRVRPDLWQLRDGPSSRARLKRRARSERRRRGSARRRTRPGGAAAKLAAVGRRAAAHIGARARAPHLPKRRGPSGAALCAALRVRARRVGRGGEDCQRAAGHATGRHRAADAHRGVADARRMPRSDGRRRPRRVARGSRAGGE